MIMGPEVRKFALTAHLTCSLGWFGAVAVFLALAVVGLTSQDAQLMRAAYRVLEPVTWLVIVPLALAAGLTGLVQALGTTWGLFRHYWVVAKLLVTVLVTGLLLQYTQTTGQLAAAAADPATSSADLRALGVSPLLHAGLALLALLVPAGLSAYKPRGVTAYGRRRVSAAPRASGPG